MRRMQERADDERQIPEAGGRAVESRAPGLPAGGAAGSLDEPVRLRQVVGGGDGSGGARAGLDWALREARLRGLAVRLVTVWPADQPAHLREEAIGGPGVAAAERD